MLGNPIGVGAFKGLDLVLGNPVELLTGNVVVDLRRTLTVRAVGAAQIRRVRNPRGTLFPRSAAEATSFGTGAIELAGAALRTVAEAAALTVTLTMGPVTKRFAVAVAEVRARIPITTWTITKGFAVTIALTTRTVAKRLTITIAEARTRIPITTRTITKRLTITIALTTRTVAKRLTITIALTTRTVAKRLTITITKARTRIPITTRTITKRLTITIATGSAGSAITVVPGTESSRLAPGIVVGAERAAIATATAEVAAVAAVVLSHDGVPPVVS
ncbi:hypothetical protein [Arthrobacter sp. MA-N2]|uniref:hypothetical protein n=2 Tax=Arthrobacter sp. MA-N2 TaxID=1101188 RepID=UPI0004B5AA83|nr:hypothetical protein [Arthrobacter sp. MA-N2]